MVQNEMTLNEKKAEFVAFCIETYKMKHGGISGAKVAEYFDDSGTIDFLFEHYDVLHTLGREQILYEIEEFLKHRGS